MGSSYGGRIVLNTANYMENLAGIVLISGVVDLYDISNDTSYLEKIKIYGFYGNLDSLSLNAELFFNKLTPSNSEHFVLFNDEGHEFHMTSTWLCIYKYLIEKY